MIDQAVLAKIKPGARVRVVEKVLMDLSEERKGAKVAVKSTKAEKVVKERVSTFEGIVIARKHGSQPGATFTVRATVAGIGMEKVYPIYMPTINKIEILSSPKKVGRAKLYYMRDLSAKGIRNKMETA